MISPLGEIDYEKKFFYPFVTSRKSPNKFLISSTHSRQSSGGGTIYEDNGLELPTHALIFNIPRFSPPKPVIEVDDDDDDEDITIHTSDQPFKSLFQSSYSIRRFTHTIG